MKVARFSRRGVEEYDLVLDDMILPARASLLTYAVYSLELNESKMMKTASHSQNGDDFKFQLNFN